MKPYPIQLEISSPTAMWTRRTKAEICAPVQFHRYTTNYGAPLRPETPVREIKNHDMPAMLRTVFDQMQYGVNRN